MTDVQWRQIVRLLFPCSADDRYADRLYKAMTKDKGAEKLLFKDLVISLWELTERGRTSKFTLEQGVSTTAQFAFQLLGPDEKVRSFGLISLRPLPLFRVYSIFQELVSETAFFDYVRCVFALKARKKESSSNLGLPTGSIYRTKVPGSPPKRHNGHSEQ